ncbi:MAG: type VI secretion system lipoprotein TssJ [Candidatus Accumulibacter sp.]|jgi:type VI secretion system VasD/TssJ family lipoprotein|nr:type VI secretion system lipoprotein TssJ [Accumulibacter sp.]
MRRGRFLRLLSGTLLLLAAACGGKNAVAPPMPEPAPVEDPSRVVWQAAPGGLRLDIEAASDLNTQDGMPLALSLCVFQLDKTDKFDDLVKTPEGLDKLQACTVDAADATSAKRFWLQPGQKLTEDMDRAEGARTMAVAAGYAHLEPKLSHASFRYLLHTARDGYIPGFRKTVYSATKMNIVIRLTATQVSINGVERDAQ